MKERYHGRVSNTIPIHGSAGVPVWEERQGGTILKPGRINIKQVPIQIQLGEHGLSLGLIERLIETNFWLRRIPYAACAGLFLWMAAQAMGAGGEKHPQR